MKRHFTLLISMKYLLLGLMTLWSFQAVAQQPATATSPLEDLRVLSSPAFEGRRTGTPGGQKAREYLLGRFEQCGLKPAFSGSYTQAFSFGSGDKTTKGQNIAGLIQGKKHPGQYIVLSAHYDHLGTSEGKVFHGADDNASGVAGMLAAAAFFQKNPPDHSILFIAFDAEELGLRGSKFFVEKPAVPLKSIIALINLDMIGRNDQNELWACGTNHYDFLKAPLEVAAKKHSAIKLRFGHDSALGMVTGEEDWSSASDHGPFHRQGVPFIYFGVEDHADYHRSTDTFERIQPKFFNTAVLLITDALLQLDAQGQALFKARQ